jgi:hypothetical protein
VSEPTRFPLAWPAHRPRKTLAQRRDGKFPVLWRKRHKGL